MKLAAATILAGALTLAACGDADAPAEVDGTTAEAPAETTVVTQEVPVPVEGDTDEGSSLTIDGGDVDATISEDGVNAEIKVD